MVVMLDQMYRLMIKIENDGVAVKLSHTWSLYQSEMTMNSDRSTLGLPMNSRLYGNSRQLSKRSPASPFSLLPMNRVEHLILRQQIQNTLNRKLSDKSGKKGGLGGLFLQRIVRPCFWNPSGCFRKRNQPTY